MDESTMSRVRFMIDDLIKMGKDTELYNAITNVYDNISPMLFSNLAGLINKDITYRKKTKKTGANVFHMYLFGLISSIIVYRHRPNQFYIIIHRNERISIINLTCDRNMYIISMTGFFDFNGFQICSINKTFKDIEINAFNDENCNHELFTDLSEDASRIIRAVFSKLYESYKGLIYNIESEQGTVLVEDNICG